MRKIILLLPFILLLTACGKPQPAMEVAKPTSIKTIKTANFEYYVECIEGIEYLRTQEGGITPQWIIDDIGLSTLKKCSK